MIAISDTSPINYLVLIDCTHILPLLFDEVIIPYAVVEELNDERAPEVVRQWVSALPAWAVIRSADAVDDMRELGRGERDAISLAEGLNPDALLMDDWRARKVARARGFPVMGTLLVLEIASQQGIIDLAEAFARLQKTSFHVTPELIQSILDRQP